MDEDKQIGTNVTNKMTDRINAGHRLNFAEQELDIAIASLPDIRREIASLDVQLRHLIDGVHIMPTTQQKETVYLVGIRNVLHGVLLLEQVLQRAYIGRLNYNSQDFTQQSQQQLEDFKPSGRGS